MANKNYTKTPTFTTNYNSKSLILHKLSHFSHRPKKQNALQFSIQSGINEFPDLKQSIQSSDNQFNDFTFKSSKSQALKQSLFTKTRLHIYRRKNKLKWMQNIRNNESIQFLPIKTNDYSAVYESMTVSQKKISFLKGRKLMNLTDNRVKIKTSPQETYNHQQNVQQEEDSNQQIFVDQAKINLIASKLSPLRKQFQRKEQQLQGSQINQINNRPVQYKFKTNPIKLNFFKVNNQGSLNATHLYLTAKRSELQETKRTEQSKRGLEKEREFYQAWENPQGQNMNRNQIVQYTNERIQTITPTNSQHAVFSSKKKGKFNIRSRK